MIILNKIQKIKNQRRFYTIDLSCDLFGNVNIVRYWGPIGAKGVTKNESFNSILAASVATQRLRRAKLRRGYLEHR